MDLKLLDQQLIRALRLGFEVKLVPFYSGSAVGVMLVAKRDSTRTTGGGGYGVEDFSDPDWVARAVERRCDDLERRGEVPGALSAEFEAAILNRPCPASTS